MASLAALESLLQYLQSRFPHLAVEYFPEKPDDYRLNHPHGALLLSYSGSKYAPSADTAIVTQEEAISFAVTVVMRRLNGREGAVDVADQVGRALLGFHPSLLPRHRGRDAVRWAIHMREPVTGGSVYWLDDGADTGPIAAQDWCHIHPDDTPAALWRRELAPMGLRLLGQVLKDIQAGRIIRKLQSGDLATWEPAWVTGMLMGERT